MGNRGTPKGKNARMLHFFRHFNYKVIKINEKKSVLCLGDRMFSSGNPGDKTGPDLKKKVEINFESKLGRKNKSS